MEDSPLDFDRSFVDDIRALQDEPRKSRGVIVTAIIGSAVMLGALAWLATEARAHSWFEGTKDPVLGVECCDNRDCVEITDADVTQIAGGYVYKPLDDGTGPSPNNPGFVPDERILPSQSYGYAVCIGGGGTGMYGVHIGTYVRCFFAPSGF